MFYHNHTHIHIQYGLQIRTFQLVQLAKQKNSHNHLIYDSCLAILESIPLELRLQNNTNRFWINFFSLSVLNYDDYNNENEYDDERWQNVSKIAYRSDQR